MDSVSFTISGLSPLILHRFSDEKVNPRKRDADAEARSALYVLEDGTIYYPAENLLRALVSGGSYHKVGRRSAATIVAGAVQVEPYALDLKGDWTIDARPVVIAKTKGRIMRYRPIFSQWAIAGLLVFDSDILGTDEVLREIVDTTGRQVGIGDYRPEKRGSYGRFRVTRWEDPKD